jgi:hypothetical protein
MGCLNSTPEKVRDDTRTRLSSPTAVTSSFKSRNAPGCKSILGTLGNPTTTGIGATGERGVQFAPARTASPSHDVTAGVDRITPTHPPNTSLNSDLLQPAPTAAKAAGNGKSPAGAAHGAAAGGTDKRAGSVLGRDTEDVNDFYTFHEAGTQPLQTLNPTSLNPTAPCTRALRTSRVTGDRITRPFRLVCPRFAVRLSNAIQSCCSELGSAPDQHRARGYEGAVERYCACNYPATHPR